MLLDIHVGHPNPADCGRQPAIMEHATHVLEVADGGWAGERDVGRPTDYLDFVALDDTVLVIIVVHGDDDTCTTGTCGPC